MLILFDADDTVENLLEPWLAMLNERYGTAVTLDDIHAWDISEAFPTLRREQVYDVLAEDELWRRVTPIDGAQRVLQRLCDEGHELYMVTASDYRSCKAKIEALLEMFPFLDWEHVIVTSNKQLVRGDVLIDDGPHNLTGGSYRKLLFDRPYNRAFDETRYGITRVYSWEEIYSLLSKTLLLI